jgi:hypothetical protein
MRTTPARWRAFAFLGLFVLSSVGTANAQTAAPSREPLLDDSNVIGLAKAEFQRLRAGKVDRSLYTPELAGELKDAQIQAAKHDELDPLGAPLKFTLTRTVSSAGHRVYQYLVRCEHGTVIYTITFLGPKNLEDGVYITPIGPTPTP